MLFSIQQKTASVLGLAMAVSSAPLNERPKSTLVGRGLGLGWLCHFDGQAAPSVDASLNLPLMLGGLCAKVNYDYDGCNSFKPDDGRSDDDGNPVDALSIPQDDDSSDANHSKPKDSIHHKKPKHRGHGPDNSAGAQSFNVADGDVPTNPTSGGQASSPNSHHKKPKPSGGGPSNSVGAESFNTDDGHVPTNPKSGGQASSSKSHHKKPKHHGKGGSTGAQSFNQAGDDGKPKKNHSSSVGALAAQGDDSTLCNDEEYYSSQLQQCVNKNYFSQANDDSSCQNGALDAVLNLCLDISLLGLTEIHAEASVLPFGPGPNGQIGCPAGQQLSSLLNVCVDQKFFTNALADNQCSHGWKLDLVLGTCLDLVGCKCQGDDD